MRIVPVEMPSAFGPDSRGPELERWLVDSDLLFPDSGEGFGPSRGDIAGAQIDGGWVVFGGLQVIQIVPEEVHSGWHVEMAHGRVTNWNICRVEDSPWLGAFDPRHLHSHHHFIVGFYDEVVEVLCRDLLFGDGTFDLENAIATHPQLGYAYLRRAISRRKQERFREAASDFEQYISLSTDAKSVEYARRCLELLTGAGEA